jgi:hypothetical protein
MQSKPKASAEGFDVILVTPERVLVSQHRPDAKGLISILKCLKTKSYVCHYLGGSWFICQDTLQSERG